MFVFKVVIHNRGSKIRTEENIMKTLLKAISDEPMKLANSSIDSLDITLVEPRQNLLLASLPYSELSLWEHELELVDLKLGQILCEPGIKHTHVIFPTTAIVSLLYTTQEGTSSEVSVVGKDGVVGMSVFMGGNETPNQALVQSPGKASV